MKTKWLSDLIEQSFNARMIPAGGEDDDTAIELMPELLEELKKDSFVSSKLIEAPNHHIGKNGKGVFMLQKKVRARRDQVRKPDFEVTGGPSAQGGPIVKRMKPNLDASMFANIDG